MFLDLYIALDLKSNPVDSSHFENNFKRTINCPAARANMNEPSIRSRAVEPDPKQFCMARAGAKNFLDGGAGAKILDGGAGAEIWLPVPQK